MGDGFWAVTFVAGSIVMCHGALKAEKYVLTTGECATRLKEDKSEEKLVKTGIIRRRYKDPTILEQPIAEYFIHPKFDNNTGVSDIAIISVEKPFELGPTLRVVELPKADDELKAGSVVNVIVMSSGKSSADKPRFDIGDWIVWDAMWGGSRRTKCKRRTDCKRRHTGERPSLRLDNMSWLFAMSMLNTVGITQANLAYDTWLMFHLASGKFRTIEDPVVVALKITTSESKVFEKKFLPKIKQQMDVKSFDDVISGSNCCLTKPFPVDVEDGRKKNKIS